METGRRRRWCEAEKLRIVEESDVGRRQVSATARRNGISRTLLMSWRRARDEGRLGVEAPVTFTPLVVALEPAAAAVDGGAEWHAPIAKAMDYMLTRWERFTPFLEDGRVCLSNNAAERSLRGAALGRKAWLFAGSERGGERAAFMYTLIATATLNDVDPQAWLADVLARIAGTPMLRLSELLPWNREAARQPVKAA